MRSPSFYERLSTLLFPPLNPPPPTFFDIVGNYCLLLAGLAILAFTISYVGWFAWRTTSGGRAIVVFVTGLSVLLGYTILTRAFGGDWPFRDIIRAAVYAYLAFGSLRLLWNLWQTWRRGNHAELITPKQRAGRDREDRATTEAERLLRWVRVRRQDREKADR